MDYIYIVKTILDNKVQLTSQVESADGIMLCDGKICAVLKRYTPPVDMTQVLKDLQQFTSSTPAQPSSVEENAAPPKPAPVNAEPIRQQAPKRSPDGMIRHLSDLWEAPKTSYSKATTYRDPDADRKLQAIGDAFFANCNRVLIDKPGNTPALRLEAIRRLKSYWENMPITCYSFAGNVSIYNGAIEFKYDYESGSSDGCYDGGCGGYSSSTSYFLALDRISEEAYLSAKKKAPDRPLDYNSKFRYRTDLPFQEETEVVMDFYNESMYLKNPMGIAGYFVMSDITR